MLGAHPSAPSFLTNHQPLSSFSTTSTISSFFSDISPSWPSNANLARYEGTSGLAAGGGGGGGGALLRGGAGGTLALAAVDVDTEEALEEVGVGLTIVEMGSGCAAGLRTPDLFWKIFRSAKGTKYILPLVRPL